MELWEEFLKTLTPKERKNFNSSCRCIYCQRIRDKYDKFVSKQLTSQSKAEMKEGE